MAEITDGFWQFAELLNVKDNKAGGRTAATVSRVDSAGTVWVTLPGAVEETPINGAATADVSPGDVVSVTIADGRADLDGNASSPAVGQREVDYTVAPVANMAERAAEEAAAVHGIAEQAQTAAAEALEVATATGQHFWADDGGAHVSTTADNPTGTSNSLWNAAGLLIRKAANLLVSITQSAIAFYDGTGNNASNVVASFGSSGAQIGKSGSANVTLDSSCTAFSGAGGAELLTIEAENGHAVIEAATTNMYVRNTGANGETANLSTWVYGGESDATLSAANSGGSASQGAQTTSTGSYATSHVERGGGSSDVEAYVDNNGASSVRIDADDVLIDTANARYQFTGAGNIRNNDSAGNATAYFMKYDATRDTRTQLEHRGACIWQNSSGNLHLANGMSDSAATWEYSFEAGGLYRRTKSGSTWSSWTKLA